MANDTEEYVAFSVRIKSGLCAQIDERREVSKRTRNKEIEFLLEKAIDVAVENDRKLAEAMRDLNQRSNPS